MTNEETRKTEERGLITADESIFQSKNKEMFCTMDLEEKENMVNGTNPARSTSHDFFGISISGVFTYSEVSLSDAIDIYNKIRY